MNERRGKIGIVGGAGFIGSSLARYFSESFEIKILDVRRPSGDFENNVTYRHCDVRDYESLRRELSDVDLVFHEAIIQIPLVNENKKLAYEVNVLGTQNVCEAVKNLPKSKGMILASSWHTIGERGLAGVVNEEFGFRPDKVEYRGRLYTLSKMAQEAIARFYNEMSEKIYGIIRTGTVLGEGMPRGTAADVFISEGLKGRHLTPYKHSMHRPMLYVDISDVCKAYESFSRKILNHEIGKSVNSPVPIVNIYFPEPLSIFDLAETVRDIVAEHTGGRIHPDIDIVDQGLTPLFSQEDKARIRVDVGKAKEFLGIDRFLSARESLERIVRKRLTL